MMRESSSVRLTLIFRQRTFDRRLRRLAAGPLARGRSLGLARRHLGFVLGHLAPMALLGPRLDRRPRFFDLAQPLFAPRQFVRDRHSVRNVRLVRRLGLGHQVGDLGFQLRLNLACVFIGERAVPARVGVDLRPIQPDRAHLQHAHLASELQHVDEQSLDVFQEPPSKVRNRVVVGMSVAREETKRHRIVGRPLQLATGENPRRITVNQYPQQHPRMIRCRTGPTIGAAHPAEVQFVDHFANEPRQMFLRQPLVHRRRQHVPALPIDRPEIAHDIQIVEIRESVHVILHY
jgi:hypothetical protein